MRSFLVILALLVLGAVLRLRGNDLLLPLLVEPDPHCAIQVRMIEEEVEDPHLNDDWGKYPHLVAWTTIALTDPAPPAAREAPLGEHLAAAGRAVWRTRFAVGLLGLLAIPATWLLARRVTSAGGALLAAALVTTSLLACHFGAQARPHGAAIAFSTLTLWAWARVAARGTWGDYALGSICGALAVGTLQSGLALGFPALAAHLVSSRRAGGNPWLLGGRRALRLAVPLGALALSVALFSPFLFGESLGKDGAQVAIEDGKLYQAGHRINFELLNGKGFGILLAKALTWEPALALGLMLAALAIPLGRPVPAIAGGGAVVLWSYAVPYLLVNGMYDRVYERFLLPLVPVIAVAAAWGVARLCARNSRPAMRLGLVGLLLVPPTVVASKLTELRVRPTTQEQAAQWLVEHATPGDRVLVTRGTQLPLWGSVVSQVEEGSRDGRRPRHRSLDWNHYQVDHFEVPPASVTWDLIGYPPAGVNRVQLVKMTENPAAFAGRWRADVVVAERFAQGRIHTGLDAIHQELRARAEGGVLARFSPDPAGKGTDHPLAYQDEVSVQEVRAPWMAWRVLRAERLGPTIEVLGPIERMRVRGPR